MLWFTSYEKTQKLSLRAIPMRHREAWQSRSLAASHSFCRLLVVSLFWRFCIFVFSVRGGVDITPASRLKMTGSPNGTKERKYDGRMFHRLAGGQAVERRDGPGYGSMHEDILAHRC